MAEALADEDRPHRNDSIRCKDCGSDKLLSDSQSTESILVCAECGTVADEAFFDCNYNSQEMFESSIRSRHGSLRSTQSKWKSSYGMKKDTFTMRKEQLKAEIARLSDKMRLKNHERKLCEERGNQFLLSLKETRRVYPYTAMAAGVIYLTCTNKSQLDMSKLRRFCPKVSHKLLAATTKLIKTEFSKYDRDREEGKTTEEQLWSVLDMVGVVKDLEKKKCIELTSELWEMLKMTGMYSRQLATNPSLMAAGISVVLEFMRKSKINRQDELKVAKSVEISVSRLNQHVNMIKVAMLSLASMIPSLEDMCHTKLLTKGSVVRHLPTILSNKEFIKLQKKLYGESVSTAEESFAYDPTKHPSSFSTCQQESQTSETLSDIDSDDVDQYIASENEVVAKKAFLDLSSEVESSGTE